MDKVLATKTLALLLIMIMTLPVAMWLMTPPIVLVSHGVVSYKSHKKLSKPLLLLALSVECLGLVMLSILKLKIDTAT